jgi:hypothetical protein
MRLRPAIASSLVGCLALACASANGPSTSTAQPSPPSWSGNLQPTQQRSGALVVTGQTKAFGSVRITPVDGSGMLRYRVAVTVSLPISVSTSVRWAILPERCGSGELPVIGFEQFPLIEVSSNGRGQLTTELPMQLTAGGSYHVNVYYGGQQLDNVVTCGNLRFDEGTPG